LSRDIPDSELNAEIWRLCRFLMPLKPKDEDDEDFDEEPEAPAESDSEETVTEKVSAQ
jgi:hypothetical protein